MKRISFNVAKVIKDAGYPQGLSSYLYNEDGSLSSRYDYEQWNLDTSTKIDAPYAMGVWLWLWDKGICIEIKDNHYYTLAKVNNERIPDDTPEEAIIAAIDYLVDNELIK